MEDNFTNFYEKPFRPLKVMSRQELEKELSLWRNMWTWIDEEVQYWLTRVRSDIKVVRRNYSVIDGKLATVHFAVKELEIDTTERLYNYSKGLATYETKTVVIPLSMVADFEFIYTREVIPEQYDGVPIEKEINELENANIERED